MKEKSVSQSDKRLEAGPRVHSSHVDVDSHPKEFAAGRIKVRVVDVDVHLQPEHGVEELQSYFPEPWRSNPTIRRRTSGRAVYIQRKPMRLDAVTADGRVPGSYPPFVGQQLFVEAGIDYAVIIPQGPPMSPTVDPEGNVAVSAAINEWQAATWLSSHNAHGRYYGSISIAVSDPMAAAREIDKWASHPKFVQVFIPHHGGAPYGQRRFWPIWEAASRNRIPIAMHVNGGGPDPLFTPTGFFEHFTEYHAIGYPATYAAHLASLLCEGVFDKFPDLRVVFVEGGFSWVAPVIWRLDKNWRVMRTEIPDMRRQPSSYLRDHVRFSSQPVEESDDPKEIAIAYEMADAKHLLMFSSDYPHFDFDSPLRAISSRLAPDVRERIFALNALDFFDLPATRSTSEFDPKA
jgi:uncharacterized protein